MNITYPDFQSASKALLIDSVKIAQSAGNEFVVIGGWSPLLLNSTIVKHPGTRDVDLLFKHGATVGELESVVKAFLANGYKSSAKHSFQVLKSIKIFDRDFIFNVDILHSASTVQNDLFVDHLTIDNGELLFRYQSIKVPLSTLLFEDCGQTLLEVETDFSDEKIEKISVPLMSELGTLLTKVESMLVEKRPRDVFDVCLAIYQARDWGGLIDSIHENCISDRLANLSEINSSVKLRNNIEKYWPHDLVPVDVLLKKVEEFCDEIGV